jgi:hypothetical protein
LHAIAPGDEIPERGLVAIRARFERPRADLEIDTDALDVDAATGQLEDVVLDWLNE